MTAPAATPETAPAEVPESVTGDLAKAYAIIDSDADNDEPAKAPTEPEPSGDDGEKSETSETKEPDAEAQEPPTEPVERTYKVKVNGETREVAEKELIAGYSRLEDYKAKTAETARAREAAETERAGLSTERQRVSDQLGVMIQYGQTFDPVLVEGAKINWAKLAQEDPVTYQEKWPPYFHRTQQLTAMAQERARLQETERGEYEKKEAVKLVEKIPEWADGEKRRAAWDDIVSTMTEHYGFTAGELGQTRDHRAIVMARDLVAYHHLLKEQAKAKKTAEAKKAESSSSTVRPGTSQDQNTKQSAKLVALKKQAMRRGDTRSALQFLNAAVANLPEE